MKFYELNEVRVPRYSGSCNAANKWGMPGAHCPVCDAIWSMGSDAYPSVDLSNLPEKDKYTARLEQDYVEFERLREQVRSLMPTGVPIWPGTSLGPLVGTAQGEFGPLFMSSPWKLLIQREALEQLQAAGVRGLKGCRTELRFRRKNPPELLEAELLPRGRLHPDCLPADRPAPCAKCGRKGWRLPDEPILAAASLPTELDLFRLGDFTTMIIGSERFVEAVRQLGYEQDLLFRELPLR
jgi:uncharacterized double-CXXCG motif protein